MRVYYSIYTNSLHVGTSSTFSKEFMRWFGMVYIGEL